MDFKNILAKFDAVDNTAKVKSIAQPSKKDAMQSILESFDRVAEAAKPDFLDLDKDGDKKESMAKAAKDKEEAKESVEESPESMDNMNDEVHAENRIQELEDALEEIKAKIDELMSLNEAPILAPILGIAGRALAGKAARKIGSAAVGAAMGGGDSDAGSKSTPAHLEPNRVAALKARESIDKELEEAIMVSAEGSEAEALLQILKLSGMPTTPAIAAPAADLDTMDIEMQDEYSNSPDEFEQDVNAVIANGTDLHREKGQYPAAARGDNPMNAFEGKFKSILADLLKE